jgi:hypothetical protein
LPRVAYLLEYFSDNVWINLKSKSTAQIREIKFVKNKLIEIKLIDSYLYDIHNRQVQARKL